MTLNHLVRGSSPRRLTKSKGGGPVTLVSWAFAPEWLTIEEASTLSGHPLDVLSWLIEDGAIDTRNDGGWLIEKASLRKFQETLVEVLHDDRFQPNRMDHDQRGSGVDGIQP